MARSTVADLAERQAQTEQNIAGITNLLTTLVERLDQGQHATTTKVAEKVKAETVSPRDLLKAGVEAKGLHFAKGGALIGSVAVAEAIVRVLKANKVGGFEVVSVQGDITSMDKRKVTHVGVVLLAPGVFTTQYVFTPEQA